MVNLVHLSLQKVPKFIHNNQNSEPQNVSKGRICTSRISKIDFTLNMSDRKILKFPNSLCESFGIFLSHMFCVKSNFAD